MTLVSFLNTLWSTLSVVAEILALIFIVAQFSPKIRQTVFVKFFRARAILLAFIVSGLAMAGSLTYSDVIGYAPCVLCWYQRICMYPLALLMGIALGRRDEGIKIYGLVLSIIGALIALYHYVGQLGYTALPCSALGYSVSCSQQFVLEFGYITIPMMAFSAFALIATTLGLALRRDQDPTNA